MTARCFLLKSLTALLFAALAGVGCAKPNQGDPAEQGGQSGAANIGAAGGTSNPAGGANGQDATPFNGSEASTAAGNHMRDAPQDLASTGSDASAESCPSGERRCGTRCVTGCCMDIDCPAQAGKDGHCDPGKSTCSYSCEPDTKPCNGICIAGNSCCDNETVSCTTSCGSGIRTCIGGVWGACSASMPAPETCDGKDNDCNGTIDDLTEICANRCTSGTRRCTNGQWDDSTCPPSTVECCSDSECGRCQKCADGRCMNQGTSEDKKNECSDGACRSGFCNGNGGCDVRSSGADPAGLCQRMACRTGNCAGNGVCEPSPRGRSGTGCSGTCQQCDGAGSCNTLSARSCWPDGDNDGFGNAAGQSQQQCGTCGSGYADNNRDCYDRNPTAKPGQTGYFAEPRGDSSFDYNCNGGVEYDPKDFYPNCEEVAAQCRRFHQEYDAPRYCGTRRRADAVACAFDDMGICNPTGFTNPQEMIRCR